MLARIRNQKNWALLAAALATTQVSAAAAPHTSPKMRMALEPKPVDTSTLEAQLKRFRGQTEFLNPVSYNRFDSAPKAGQRSDKEAAGGSDPRSIQESDVYKIGKAGSKLLYLLNDYRGLQTVSFADGAENPKLVSRVAATGNSPRDMYYDQANDRLVVLENLWVDDSGNYQYDGVPQSRIITYDVKNPSAPVITEKLELQGEIADSRIVGDVLYVATAVRPYYYGYGRNQQAEAKGFVYSVQLGKKDLQIVQQQQLALPTSSRENMNIVEVKEGDKYKYYLLAILSESAWGWWDRQSLVEVVDISDAHGKIDPLMVVSAKGSINERSQTTIKDGTLIVTSNYQTDKAAGEKLRVAVETFALPTASAEVVTEKEAEFRKLNIDRQLANLSGDARDALYQKLIADPTLGILGRFVKTDDGKLRKIIADHVVTVGDTQGQHAQLQDVRYVGDSLYVFWVPANQIDPFDLFDISKPAEGAKYVKRLQFDGWIERAIPLTYQNHRYVLGLGHLVENVDNENGKIYPQAMLFEITGQGRASRATDIAQISLKKTGWTNFNGADKSIEVRMTGESQGTVMFETTSWDTGTWASGGKLVGFNLDAAVQGDVDHVFQEGAMLVGDSGWLKRVFSNPEIAKINTFTNTELGTFDVTGTGAATATARAISVLELARDITGFVTLNVADAPSFGVQIINRSDWSNRESSAVELRAVSTKNVDAEKADVASTLKLLGAYASHHVDASQQKLWVATTESQLVKKGTSSWDNTYDTVYHVYQIGISGNGALAVSAQASWKPAAADAQSRRPYYYYRPFELAEIGGKLVATVESELIVIDGASARTLALQGCANIADMNEVELKTLNGSLYFFMKKQVEDPNRQNVTYSRNLLAPVSLTAERASCGELINVPGNPVAVYDGQIVTEDDHLADLVEKKIDDGQGHVSFYYEPITVRAMDSLKLAGKQATLVDDYELESSQSLQAIGSHRFGFFESSSNDSGRFFRGGDMPIYRPYYSTPSRMVVVGFDEELRFTKEIFGLPDGVLAGSTLTSVIPSAGGSYLGVIVQGRKVQVLKWSDAAPRPVIQKLLPMDPTIDTLVDSVVLPGWFYGTANFSASQKTLEFPMGLQGVQQVTLAQ